MEKRIRLWQAGCAVFVLALLVGTAAANWTGRRNVESWELYFTQVGEALNGKDFAREGYFFYLLRLRLLEAGSLWLLSMTAFGAAGLWLSVCWLGFGCGVRISLGTLVFGWRGILYFFCSILPQALFYTTTVDLDLGTLVGFSDYADAQTMAEYILSDECRLYYPSASDEVLAELKAMDKTALTDILKSCDFTSVSEGTFPQSFSYENQGDIYMVLPVSHALGDYAIVRYTPDTK